MLDSLRPFHLAIPVTDILIDLNWYTHILGCKVGRKAVDWIDFIFFWTSVGNPFGCSKRR